MKTIIALVCMISLSAIAAPHAKVILLKGDVTYDGKKLVKDQMIETNGIIKVGPKSVVKIRIEKYNSVMTFAPNSKMEVKFKKDEYEKTPYTLVSGGVRWVTQGKAQYKGGIQTKSTIMGIRGTDFLVLANQAFGESEIVCFDGKVLFSNKKKTGNEYTISKGQWGGLGGRYGKYIEKPLTLPVSIVDQMKNIIKLR